MRAADDTPEDQVRKAARRSFWGSFEVPQGKQFFIEIFAGHAVLTRAVQKQGLDTLPPVEIEANEFVTETVDITDQKVVQHIKRLIEEGCVLYIHFGTPCSSFSQARKDDGGPPPLRSAEFVTGLRGLSQRDQEKVELGNSLLALSVELIYHCHRYGVKWSLENPATSFMWDMPNMRQLQNALKPSFVTFDMCRFGSSHLKPTTIWSSFCLQALALRCDKAVRPHEHVPLHGTIVINGKKTFKTRLAQVYPSQLCDLWAQEVKIVDPLLPTYGLICPPAERKRPIGQPVPWSPHRQFRSGEKARSAGYQLKKSALPPLIPVEMEPGQAVQFALQLSHPFHAAPALEPDLQEALALVATRPKWVTHQRMAAVQFWEARAHSLLPATDIELKQVSDPHLRRLLRGTADDQPIQLGSCTHIGLWREMLKAAKVIDVHLLDEMLNGFPIVGPISRSYRWEVLNNKPLIHEEELRDRAWEFSKKVVKNIAKCEVTEHTEKVWETTMEDVEEAVSLGPFFTSSEVTAIVGDPWIPTQRFEVVQKNKVRGVDSATVNGINTASSVSEKLDLPSTDVNVSALRWLRSNVDGEAIAGWVLDERKAYRQIAIRPDHRKWSVISLRQPSSGKTAFFVMVGHSFGLVSSVYNYNRRSAAITDILRRLFFVAAFNFYDDKYGFEPGQTIESAFQCAQKVHWWLGAQFDAKKLQMSSAPTILGVTYDLEGMRLLIKQKRKEEIIDEIDSIMSSGILPPGQAGKLRGKLMFGASQLWGKVGRAFLRALSERQYSNFSSVKVNSAISRSLVEWKFLLESGPPRPIEAVEDKLVDAVVFTDGSFPDGKEGAPLKPWIGGVIFIRGSRPVQFGCEVKKDLIDEWIPRKSQIAMVELFATIAALETFKSQLEGSSTLLFVDSEPVQGALVKGYSAREDMCELVSVFWRCALVLKTNLYIDRISTDANPADHPSRNRMEVGESLGWIEVEPKFPSLQRGLVETFGS